MPTSPDRIRVVRARPRHVFLVVPVLTLLVALACGNEASNDGPPSGPSSGSGGSAGSAPAETGCALTQAACAARTPELRAMGCDDYGILYCPDNEYCVDLMRICDAEYAAVVSCFADAVTGCFAETKITTYPQGSCAAEKQALEQCQASHVDEFTGSDRIACSPLHGPAVHEGSCSLCYEQCCDLGEQCLNDASCYALNNCLHAYDVDIEACRTAHADGMALWEEWTTCLEAGCADCRPKLPEPVAMGSGGADSGPTCADLIGSCKTAAECCGYEDGSATCAVTVAAGSKRVCVKTCESDADCGVLKCTTLEDGSKTCQPLPPTCSSGDSDVFVPPYAATHDECGACLQQECCPQLKGCDLSCFECELHDRECPGNRSWNVAVACRAAKCGDVCKALACNDSNCSGCDFGDGYTCCSKCSGDICDYDCTFY